MLFVEYQIIQGISILVLSFIATNYLLYQFKTSDSKEVDEWLDKNELGDYKKLFRDNGIDSVTGCASGEALERLPELPAAEEKRLRRAAQLLQQRLVLRQWLTTHHLHHAYSRLLSLDVSSLEDVYWLEDSAARHALEPKDFNAWTLARQSLPTGKEALQELKSELWSTVVKTSQHQDAWAWGGMVVVSMSVAGLVTLAAMTQPSLAPEAKHSLLQYVTGKYLHPGSCTVEWGWSEPQAVGETMHFTVHCFQRNGHPYPICDADNLTVNIMLATRKMVHVMELGSEGQGQGGEALVNTARVKFTVRHAGTYIINVLIGKTDIAGSPFRKQFLGGPVCPRRSTVGRGLSAAVFVSGAPQPVHVVPRDRYGNTAHLPSQDPTLGFSVKIRVVGEQADEKLSQAGAWSYDGVNQRVTLTLSFCAPAVYRATLLYHAATLNNGDLDCIVLTPSDAALVQRNIASKSHNICYEARLLGAAPPGERLERSRPKKVLCCLSPKQLVIKDKIFKFIPKRLTAFRLCPSTKFIFGGEEEGTVEAGGEGGEAGLQAGSFYLEDGIQPALLLASPDRNLIAAAFTHLLLANIGGSDTFKDKQDFFFCEVRKCHNKHPHEKLSVRVSRDDLLRSSYRATKHFTLADWCKNFDVTFQGEQGVDWGGVRREWFSLLCAQLFDHKHGLFVSFTGSPTGLVHPNPSRPPHLKLKHFELAGKIVGKCLYESALGGSYRQLVRARFTRSFLAQIIGLRVHYKHFEQDDPDLYLSKIKYILETDLDAADCATEIYFSEEEYDNNGKLVTSIDLIPNGSTVKVTNASKQRYLCALAQWRLAARCRAEVEAFLRGLGVLLPDNLLSIFDEGELELVVCGSGSVCVQDWRAHSLVQGSGREWQRVVSWLWTCLASYSAEERARLLQFTTGSSQLPPGGFKDLQPRFQLTMAPSFGALPTAHTCFNQLCLPLYDSYDQLVHALTYALTEGADSFAMI